jgi:hypothetical protein
MGDKQPDALAFYRARPGISGDRPRNTARLVMDARVRSQTPALNWHFVPRQPVKPHSAHRRTRPLHRFARPGTPTRTPELSPRLQVRGGGSLETPRTTDLRDHRHDSSPDTDGERVVRPDPDAPLPDRPVGLPRVTPVCDCRYHVLERGWTWELEPPALFIVFPACQVSASPTLSTRRSQLHPGKIGQDASMPIRAYCRFPGGDVTSSGRRRNLQGPLNLTTHDVAAAGVRSRGFH